MEKKYFFIGFICFLSQIAYSQVVINEVSNANGSNYVDANGESDDWIELYNVGSNSVNLKNYSISDDGKEPRKWVFPSVSINPHSYLLLLASGEGKNKGPLHLNFKLSAEGETIILTDHKSKVIDYFTIGNLQNNHSNGRKPDGSLSHCLFNESTPGKSNNSSHCYDGYEPEPIFSLQGGMFSGPQLVEISGGSATAITKYTTNGSFPGLVSAIYNSPISVSSSKVLAAKNFSSANRLPSNTARNTYLINESGLDLPVFSISLPSYELFDTITGMYMMGPNADSLRPYYGANFWRDWEKLCHVEYYDKQKVKKFELDAGLKIHGGYSRSHPQKSFRINCRGRYGASKIDYPLIPEKVFIKSFESFNLRNGGSDFGETRFRDAFLQRIMKKSHVGIMGYEPALVFINGEYWGEYEIREREDEKYIEENFGVPSDKLDMLTTQGHLKIKHGSASTFYALHDYAVKANPQASDFYQNMSNQLDLENVADYFAAETYYNNRDWILNFNNTKLWHSQLPGGKWRYLFWDLDHCAGYKGRQATDPTLSQAINPDSANQHSDIFRALCKNIKFRNYFVNRYADLMNINFQQENMKNLAYAMRDSISSSMPRHFARWGGTYSGWIDYIEKMLSWNKLRLPFVRNQIQSEFNLAGQVDVTLKMVPEEAGRIRISTVIPEKLPWTGVYYNGVPVTITAIPNPGYIFKHWGINSILGTPNTNKSITLNIDQNAVFTAYFTGTGENAKLAFSEINYHPDSSQNDGDWVELYNYGTAPVDLTGWQVKDGNDLNLFEIPFGTVINAQERIVFSADTTRFIAQHALAEQLNLQLPFRLKNSSDKIRLFDYKGHLKLSVTYSDISPWPQGADGNGRTLELSSTEKNYNDPTNWFDGCMKGSPKNPFGLCNENIVFSEINYFPGAHKNTGDWVELHNTSAVDLDLTGWKFKDSKDSNSFSFPNNVILPANGYLVLCRDPSRFKSLHPTIKNYTGPFPFELVERENVLRLFDNKDLLNFSVVYNTTTPWPSEAAGKGKTLELKDEHGLMNSGDNWFAGCLGGSPGREHEKGCGAKDPENSDPVQFSIWPNPSKEIMTINIEEENIETMSLKIFDLLGIEINRIDHLENPIILNKKDFPSGIYFVKIGNDENQFVKKIIFQ